MSLTEDKNIHASWQASTFDMHHFVTIRQLNLDISPQHISEVFLLTKGNDDIDKGEKAAEDCGFFQQSALYSSSRASNSFRQATSSLRHYWLSPTRLAQISCVPGESSLNPVTRESCKPFEKSSTSFSSIALIILSTKRLKATSYNIECQRRE